MFKGSPGSRGVVLSQRVLCLAQGCCAACFGTRASRLVSKADKEQGVAGTSCLVSFAQGHAFA